jgi:hypothetical protein
MRRSISPSLVILEDVTKRTLGVETATEGALIGRLLDLHEVMAFVQSAFLCKRRVSCVPGSAWSNLAMRTGTFACSMKSALEILLRLAGGAVKKEEDRRELQMTRPESRCQARESRTLKAVYDRILIAGTSSMPLRASLHRAGSTSATIGKRPAQGCGTYVQAGRSADYGLGGSGDPSPSPLLEPTVRGVAVQRSASTETSRSDNILGRVPRFLHRAPTPRTTRLTVDFLSPETSYLSLFDQTWFIFLAHRKTIRYGLYSRTCFFWQGEC